MSGPQDAGASSSEVPPLVSSALVRLMLSDQPERIVLIGTAARTLDTILKPHCTCQHFDTVDACAAALADDRKADMVLLWLDAEESDANSALGMTCRLFPQRVLVRVSGRQPVMPASRFFAFGFHRVPLPDEPGSAEEDVLYEYRLADYKQPPDWLNAKYWANPQRFDVLEAEFDDSGKPLPEGRLKHSDDDYEPDEDEYE